jgi:ferritin-like metal-binding protein YciE
MNLTTLEDVLADQLADLQSAEQQLTEALPKMAAAASTDELRTAFTEHLEETHGHIERLREAISTSGVTIEPETCEAMQGLIREGSKVIAAEGNPVARDAALIGAAQRVEHYEIAAYGTARALARELDLNDTAALLNDTLAEESAADERLTKIATGGMLSSGVNKAASR